MPSSSGAGLAIVPDKRPSHRPGGCVGSILFQLFDWNRRFAKKKLFPRKLLPPVRATKKKKFGDEKMPVAKFLLIAADENRGGFPMQKKATPEAANAASPPATTSTGIVLRTSGMRSPSLVARLMGLEAMPPALQDKPRKAVDSLDRRSLQPPPPCSSRHDLDLDLEVANGGGGHGKKDHPRPQKTGFFDRRRSVNESAARIGSEVLQLDNRTTTLSRGRKKDHHKLVSPVKSPRILTKKNSARLMGAAVKILEPGLQRRRCALTYGNSTQRNAGAALSSPEKLGGEAKKYGSPCKNCGASLQMEMADRNPRHEQQQLMEYDVKPSVSGHPNTFYCSEEYSSLCASKLESTAEDRHLIDRKPRSQHIDDRRHFDEHISWIRNPRHSNEDKPSSFSSHQPVGNGEKKLATNRKQHAQYRQDQSNLSGDSSISTRRAIKQTSARQTQVLPSARNKTTGPPTQQSRREPDSVVKICRDSIIQTRNATLRAQAKALPRPPATSRVGTNKQKIHLIQRTRPLKGNNTQARSTNAPKSIPPRSRAGRTTSASSSSALVTESTFVNARSRKQAKDSSAPGNGSSKDTEMVSFNTHYKRDSVPDSSSRMGRIDNKSSPMKSELASSASCTAKAVVTDSRAQVSEILDTVRGDELNALLEQKIKELNYLEQDESISDIGSKSGRSTATILQELILALTDEGLCETSSSYDCADDKMQEEARGESAGLGYKCDQPSPISILEASFSTDSCLSESLNSMSGQVLNFEETEGSCDKSEESWDGEAELSDSATSCSNLGKVMDDADRRIYSSCSLDGISLMYNGSRAFGPPRGMQHGYIRALISNLELLFGVPYQEEEDEEDSDSGSSCWVNTLLGTLELLCASCQANSWLVSSFPEPKDGGEAGALMRRFLCDCMLEYLDTKYSRFIIVRREKQPLSHSLMNSGNVAEEVLREVGRWKELFSLDLDDMIEEEMNRLPVQWIDFESEEWDAGKEIQQDIFQELVNEAVIEFLP